MIRKLTTAWALSTAVAMLWIVPSIAEPAESDRRTNKQGALVLEEDSTSPVLRIQRNHRRHPHRPPPNPGFRTIDGSLNNPADDRMGAADEPLLRLVPAAYADGVSALAGADRPSPRQVSNATASQSESIVNRLRVTDFLWQWGSFSIMTSI